MEITPRSRWRLRLHNILFVMLLVGVIGVLAWLSTAYKFQADWTAGDRNTLSEDSQQLLASIDEPMSITAFVPDDAGLRSRIEETFAKYQRFKPDLSISFSNADLEPERAQAAGVTGTGQLAVRVGDRTETVDDMSEQTLADALQRLARDAPRWVVFLEGHDERDPLAEINPGFSRLRDALTRSGVRVRTLNLVRDPQIPDNTTLLVIASPRKALLAGEAAKLREYVRDGGNLLWLRDPEEPAGLEPLAKELGIKFIDGVLVDANPQLRELLGIQHPAVVPVVDYGAHPVTEGLTAQTLFPFATALEAAANTDWTAEPILTTLARTWSETGSLTGREISFSSEDGDRAGPLILSLSLTRARGDVQQRVAVVGDSDFLANGYIGNGENLALATNLFNWLARDDALIAINPKGAPDTVLNLGNTQIFAVAFFFLAVLPIGLATAGLVIWLRRRRR
ncbi:MAG: GldG family protein [Gammaproteobacteria bacterium]